MQSLWIKSSEDDACDRLTRFESFQNNVFEHFFETIQVNITQVQLHKYKSNNNQKVKAKYNNKIQCSSLSLCRFSK